MSESVWIPALVALGIGLVGGAFAALRLARGSARDKAASKTTDKADRELELTDLEQRRDHLYDQLADRDLSDSERGELELAAARTLRSIEQLSGKVGRKPRPKAAASVGSPADQGAKPVQSPAKVALVGFASGAAVVALIGMLIYWASRDATPRPDDMDQGPAPMATMDDPHQGNGELPPQMAARYAQLQERLTSNPDDAEAHREAAQLLLTGGQLIGAFEHAQQLERLSAGDPDSLYVQAVVRMTIGQDEEALSLIDRVIAGDLSRISAYIVRGVLQLRLGDREGAVQSWERGQSLAGGNNPALSHFLSLAREGRSAAEILSTPPGSRPSGAPPAQATPSAPAGPIYRVRLELASGLAVPTPSVLFVSLRGEDPGPPAAVKRIENPRFPMDLTLTAADSMLGRPLPESGTLAARLDTDGNASTSTPEEPSASTETESGSSVVLRLATGG